VRCPLSSGITAWPTKTRHGARPWPSSVEAADALCWINSCPASIVSCVPSPPVDPRADPKQLRRVVDRRERPAREREAMDGVVLCPVRAHYHPAGWIDDPRVALAASGKCEGGQGVGALESGGFCRRRRGRRVRAATGEGGRDECAARTIEDRSREQNGRRPGRAPAKEQVAR